MTTGIVLSETYVNSYNSLSVESQYSSVGCSIHGRWEEPGLRRVSYALFCPRLIADIALRSVQFSFRIGI
jgi:hypothetical protein